MTYHVGDVYEQGCQFGCGFCDKKFFQKIMEEEEVSESDGNWDLGRDEDWKQYLNYVEGPWGEKN